jgi:O-antigen/teichoic acid export membrane protein
MRKTILRPLRLVYLHEHLSSEQASMVEEDGGSEMQDEDETDMSGDSLPSLPDRSFLSNFPVWPPVQENNHMVTSIASTKGAITDQVNGGQMSGSEVEARHLLKRTPNSYLLNQVYGLWFYISWFFLTVIITRKVSTNDYGTFAVALTAFNTVAYIVALGLEDATTTYIPKILAEHGQAAAASLIRRLLALRIITLVVCVAIMLFGLPVLATLISLIPLQGSAANAASLRDPSLLSHLIPIAIYVLGNGVSSLFTSVYASLMRMRPVFIIGSVTQLLLLGMGFVVLQLGWGVNGMLWLLAISSLLNALAFAIWQAPLLMLRGSTYKQALKPIVNLGISAWLTNLISGALLKQVSIILLVYFAATQTQIGFFNLSFQLAHSANLLLVTGFAGVGGSALAASFIGHNYERLARSWQVLIKIETLLAAPLLMFCLFNAQNIAHTLYGSNYDPVGPLLAIFLFFNILVRVLGTTIHQSTLYVIRKPGLVVLGQWIGLLTVLLIGLALIPHFGAAGALVGDGLSQVVTGGLLLAFLWRSLPRKYPLGFTLRLLLALALAALPSLVWHPANHVLLGISGTVFLVLCVGLLLWIRPLGAEDMEMVSGLNPRLARYLRWFAREKSR